MSTHPYYFTWNRQPTQSLFPVARAEHDEFVLDNGRRVYDFLSTSFQANFGHSHPLIQDAIQQQLATMPIASPKATFDLKHSASERLRKLIGLEGGKIFYTVSGSESVENALKMARQLTGKSKVMARQKSYHGASLGALSVTGDWRNDPHLTIDEHTIRIPEPADDPDAEETERIIKEQGDGTIAAVILETISGTNGVAIPEQRYIDAIQRLCQQYEILFIIDEVLCGFGRTGPAFAFHAYNARPDFVCMSKGITGGYLPFGAVWTGPQIVKYYDHQTLTCGLTNYAHPLGLAALHAVLSLFDTPEFLQNKARLERHFSTKLNQWSERSDVSQIRMSGLLAAIELKDRNAPDWKTCFAAGMHLYSKQNLLILSPPFVSTPERLDSALEQLESILFPASTV